MRRSRSPSRAPRSTPTATRSTSLGGSGTGRRDRPSGRTHVHRAWQLHGQRHRIRRLPLRHRDRHRLRGDLQIARRLASTMRAGCPPYAVAHPERHTNCSTTTPTQMGTRSSSIAHPAGPRHRGLFGPGLPVRIDPDSRHSSFTYTLSDSRGETSTATVTLRSIPSSGLRLSGRIRTDRPPSMAGSHTAPTP